MKSQILIFGCLALLCCHNNRAEQWTKMNELNSILSGRRLPSMIEDFNEGIPEDLDYLYRILQTYYPEDIDKMEVRYFIDPLSPNNSWVGYVPLYDSLNRHVISYIIISCGLDGKMDNDLESMGKLHPDDWKTKLKLYNPDEFTNMPLKAFVDYDLLWDEFKKGGKDLLIYEYFHEHFFDN